MGVRVSGDPMFLPVSAEQDRYERRFLNLGHRHVVLYDKLAGNQARVYKTPNVAIAKVPRGRLDMFESEHLRLTGRPAADIESEIRKRQSAVRSLLWPSKKRSEKPGPKFRSPMGEWQ